MYFLSVERSELERKVALIDCFCAHCIVLEECALCILRACAMLGCMVHSDVMCKKLGLWRTHV